MLLSVWIACAGPVLGHGDLHEQIDAVSARIRENPNNAALYLKRAELHRLHMEPEAAKADYDKAERLAPELHEVHLGRGKLLFQAGEYQEAREQLDLFLASSPNHLDALLTRARLEMNRNRPLAAAKDYARIVELSPKAEPEYYIEYARALAAAGPEHLPEALTTLDKGIAALGQLPTLSLLAVDLEVARKDFDMALTRLERLTTASTRKESWLERRGDILQQAGRPEQARAAYDAALKALHTLPARVRTRKATAELEARLRTKAGGSPPRP